MAVTKPALSNQTLEREDLARKMRQADAQAGIVGDSALTHEQLRAMIKAWMDARGIRPEDNIGSRELIKMRYGDDEE